MSVNDFHVLPTSRFWAGSDDVTVFPYQKTFPREVTRPTRFPVPVVASIASYLERQVLRPQLLLGMRPATARRLLLPTLALAGNS
jgi:hypothetical protein